jgi:TonB-dependent receptor
MNNIQSHQRRRSRQPGHQQKVIAAACATLFGLFAPGLRAQQATPPAAAQPKAASEDKATESIVITGIRKSLDSSLNLKRLSNGVVDGIVAEDIGKFPDTNLAESMQRIAGVSIDRGPSGEGSRVTVRGVGPDFNMVLLNGRQMPGAVIGNENTGANASRAFDFANLSSDAVSALEVFKTSRASSPAGGIGATINVKTARPLDSKEFVASLAVKGNYDASNARLPDSFKGGSITPEVSGIYSDTFADGTFGIAISGSYSKRNSGSNKAYTQNGWHAFRAGESGWGAIPLPGEAGANQITNRPTGNTLYATPVDLRYSLTGLQRERINGQIALQYAPSKDLKLTLDYALATNKTSKKNIEMSTWYNFQGGPSAWTDSQGGVAGPVSYSAVFANKDHDLAFNSGVYGDKSDNRSTGFNVDWKVSSKLSVEFDAHHSTASTKPDSPYGSYAVIDAAMFSQGTATGYYGNKLPILELKDTVLDTNKITVTGTQFRNNLSEQTIDQFQTRGAYKLDDINKLHLGLSFTKVDNRAASSLNQNADWGGVGKQGDYAPGLFTKDNLPKYFGQISGHDDPRLFQNFFNYDFNAVRARAIEIAMKDGTPSHPTPLTKAEAEAYFAASPDYSKGDDWRTTEKSTSAYVQFDHSFDTSIPMNVSVGLRYESTSVSSSSQVASVTGTRWLSLNEIEIPFGAPTFGTATGKYSYVLPSIDWDADLLTDLKLRASYGHTIGRPGWNALLGGVTVNSPANFGGGTGNTGNPALKPLLSKNFDMALEYYYAKSSYVAAGAFFKDITNFISGSSVRTPVGNIHTPIGGKYYNAAVASGCSKTDPVCLRKYIFANFNGQPGVTFNGFNSSGEAQGSIVGQPDDPLLQFAIGTPSNSKGDKLKGLELNAQHVFGNSGFGVSGNYTYVTSGLKFDPASTDSQQALVGVSNSYNLVGFYEDHGWSVRGAYNWRDKFFSGYGDGNGGPVITAPYAQFDLSIGYKLNKNLSFQADFINLNDGVVRQYGRTEEMLVSVTQTGRRFLVGARYRF